MRAPITFGVGVAVTVISVFQLILTGSPVRWLGVGVGLFFAAWGAWMGWTRFPGLTVLLGHLAIVTGCLVAAYGLAQLPFLERPPTLIEAFDLPLFWGLFTAAGGYCMITHGTCSCCIAAHRRRTDTVREAVVRDRESSRRRTG